MPSSPGHSRVSRLRAALLCALAGASLTACGGPAGQDSIGASGQPPGPAWYVSASAPAGGNGSPQAPFASLAAAELASAPGDTIVVLPSPIGAAPLDGGIALKPGQHLIGSGPPVTGLAATDAAPRISNSSPARHEGDAVVLADGVEVANLMVVDPYRGAIYGKDVTGVSIHGNDVSGHNTSCTQGFYIPPFMAPTTVSGVGVYIATGLPNGWAGIMVDASTAAGTVAIRHNHVHDAACGDGIDLRLSGTADLQAELSNNLVENLRQGQTFLSVLAMGMQTADQSRLRATLDYNRQANIGSSEADSEGVFAQLTGSSELIATVDHNTFTNGIGGFSANGLEFVVLGGPAHGDLRVSNSTFSDVTGDVIEQGNLGTDAVMNLVLDKVVATRSNGSGNTYLLPFNNGDCLLSAMGGSGNTVTLTVRDSELSDCVNNGISLGSNPLPRGATNNRLDFVIENSRITGNRNYNLRVLNLGALESLSGRVEGTDLGHSQGTNLAFDEQGSTGSALLDFGGGALGSAGNNCILGGAAGDAEVTGYQVPIRHNWWGSAAGPGPGRATAAGAGRLDYLPVLGAPPPACR